MTDVQIFKNSEFGEVRTIVVNNEPYFVGRDVAVALGYKDTVNALKSHVDEEDKMGWQITTPSRGTQNATIINESGVYSLVFSSKLHKAKEFKHWVTSEVLPAIRKHGAYMTEQTLNKALTSPDFLIRLATQLKEEQDKRKQLEQKAAENAPKVLFADAIVGGKNSCLVGELAKMLASNNISVGQNRLFKWLRSHHYLGCWGDYYNIPNQEYINQGLFELKKSVHDENGVMVSKVTPKVTGKGQSYFINGFLSGRFNINA